MCRQHNTNGRRGGKYERPDNLCALMAGFGAAQMSAYGYERKFWGPLISVRFTPESRPFSEQALKSANDPKQTSHQLTSTSVENRVRCTENQLLLFRRPFGPLGCSPEQRRSEQRWRRASRRQSYFGVRRTAVRDGPRFWSEPHHTRPPRPLSACNLRWIARGPQWSRSTSPYPRIPIPT